MSFSEIAVVSTLLDVTELINLNISTIVSPLK
jgi:hypothetical protein